MPRRMKTQQEAQAKYAARVQGSQQAYQQGVQNATGWVEGSLAASQRRDLGLQQAISDGRINAGIQRKTDAGWKQATLAKGPQNYAASAQLAGANYGQSYARTMGYQQEAAAATASIDTTTRAGRLQKAAVWAETVATAAERAKAGR